MFYEKEVILWEALFGDGTVTATGAYYGAGIGTGLSYQEDSETASNECGVITINGGTVTATGGERAAGIGTGNADIGINTCGAITIAAGVISVTAKKSSSNPGPNSIGKGEILNGGTPICGTITIGGTVYWDGSDYQNGGDTYLTSNITYEP